MSKKGALISCMEAGEILYPQNPERQRKNKISLLKQKGVLTKQEGTFHVLLDEVLQLKAVNEREAQAEAGAGDAGGEDSGIAPNARYERKRIDTLYEHVKFLRESEELVYTHLSIKALGKIEKIAKRELKNWKPPFLKELPKVARRVLAEELVVLERGFAKAFEAGLPEAKKKLPSKHKHILSQHNTCPAPAGVLARETEQYSRLAGLRKLLKVFYEEGSLLSAAEAREVVEDIAGQMQGLVSVIQSRMSSYVTAQRRDTLKADVNTLLAAISEAVAKEVKHAPLISESMCAGLQPPPDLDAVEWAEKNRVLTNANAEAGPFRYDRTPYAVEPLLSLTKPSVTQVTLCWAAQTSKTETLLSFLGFTADTQAGTQGLIVMPTLKFAKDMSRDKVSPMLQSTPSLKAKLTGAGGSKGQSGDGNLSKRFTNGATFNFVGANAATDLAGRSVRICLCDEIDRFPASAGASAEAGGEGSPVELAIQRTASFAKAGRKICLTSTPTETGHSAIWDYFLLGSQALYHVPCPLCGTGQSLEWDAVVWDEGEPDTARVQCVNPACQHPMTEMEVKAQVQLGEWVHKHPRRTDHLSYRISTLVNPWLDLAGLVKQYEAALGNPDKLRSFINTKACLTYTPEEGEGADVEDVLALVDESITITENSELPEDVLAVFAGVDIQKDRAEVTLLGVAPAQEASGSFRSTGEDFVVLAHHRVYGSPTDDLWRNLSEFLDGLRFKHPYGAEDVRVDSVAVDSGNWRTEVQAWADRRGGTFSINGQAGDRALWTSSNSKKKHFGVGKLYLVGVDLAKKHLQELITSKRLRVADMGEGMEEYAQQLTSEELVTKRLKGKYVEGWRRKRSGLAAEALDCFVYSYSLYSMRKSSINWSARQQAMQIAIPEKVSVGWTDFNETAEDGGGDGGWGKY